MCRLPSQAHEQGPPVTAASRNLAVGVNLCGLGLPLALGLPAGYPFDSLFHGRLISQRTATKWGDITLVTAARLLLAAALGDPMNARWVSCSGSPQAATVLLQ